MPIHILAAVALLALIWGYVFIRHAGLLGGCLAAIAIGSCLGHPFFNVSALTLDRAVVVGLAGLYFAQRNLFGLPAKKLNPIDIGLLLFVGVLAYSTLSHDWRADGAQPLATLLFFYFLPLVLYWVASRCLLTERGYVSTLVFFACFGVYLSITAVFEVLSANALVFPKYIVSTEHLEFLGRARGPFLNPVGNGLYMTVCFIATLMLWPYVRKPHRALLLAAAGLIGVGHICTLTRSVWLGLATAIVTMGVLMAPKQHRLRVVLAAGLLGVIALSATGSSLLRFKRDKNVSAAEMAESAKLRPILAAYAYEVFRDHPIAGLGFGQYRRHNIDYLTRRSFDVPMDKAKTYVQHNVFLSLLSETGLLGLSTFVGLLAIWLCHGWQLWYRADVQQWQRQIGLLSVLLLAAYVPNGMFHELSLIPMLNHMLFFFAGIQRSQYEATTAVPVGVDRRQNLRGHADQLRRGGAVLS